MVKKIYGAIWIFSLFIVIISNAGTGSSTPQIFTDDSLGSTGAFPSLLQGVFPYYTINESRVLFPSSSLPDNNGTYVALNAKMIAVSQSSD